MRVRRPTSGTTYTGDPFWVSRDACNGFIVNQGSPRVEGDCNGGAAGAAVYTSLTALPYTLGVINGTDPASNAAASSYTSGSSADNQVQFRTVDPLTLPTEGRFVTFSVDAVAQNCQVAHPELRFYLVDGEGEEIAVSSAAIDPCKIYRKLDARNRAGALARAGQLGLIPPEIPRGA